MSLYKTGDLCRIRHDGALEYFGRIDAQVKIRGFRIEPGEIEKHLTSYSSIDAAVVIAQKDTLIEERLVAYYQLKANCNAPSTGQLRHYLQQHLPEYMIPTAFIEVGSFPLTANGKLDKSLLPNPQFIMNANHKKPTKTLEKALAKIWSQELGIEEIGLDDDFFELGGHSLAAARIISKINHTLGKDISVHDFYYATNIAKLAQLINKTKKINKRRFAKNLKLFNKLSDIPLSDFQFMLWISNTFEAKAKKLNIIARKRLQGHLNIDALEFAFNVVLKKQEVLFYRILKLRPVQLLQKNISFKITPIHLESLSDEEAETALEHSIHELIEFYPWPKDCPLILAKLFYLKNDRVELQISLPHIVADDFSPQILLADLSQYYLLYNKTSDTEVIQPDKPYKEYIFNEQQIIKKHLDRDMVFWDNYLKDAGLFVFPYTYTVKNMDAAKLPYSTYTPIPERHLNSLVTFCANNHLSIKDGLSAALTLALIRCSEPCLYEPPYLYMNIIKSTRNNEAYDDTIGCFLRLEPIKISLNKQSSLQL